MADFSEFLIQKEHIKPSMEETFYSLGAAARKTPRTWVHFTARGFPVVRGKYFFKETPQNPGPGYFYDQATMTARELQKLQNAPEGATLHIRIREKLPWNIKILQVFDREGKEVSP